MKTIWWRNRMFSKSPWRSVSLLSSPGFLMTILRFPVPAVSGKGRIAHYDGSSIRMFWRSSVTTVLPRGLDVLLHPLQTQCIVSWPPDSRIHPSPSSFSKRTIQCTLRQLAILPGHQPPWTALLLGCENCQQWEGYAEDLAKEGLSVSQEARSTLNPAWLWGKQLLDAGKIWLCRLGTSASSFEEGW